MDNEKAFYEALEKLREVMISLIDDSISIRKKLFAQGDRIKTMLDGAKDYEKRMKKQTFIKK